MPHRETRSSPGQFPREDRSKESPSGFDQLRECRSSMATSPTLLAGLERRSDSAWSRLVERYSPIIIAICKQHSLDDATMRDVMQETWISVERSLPKFESTPGAGAFRAWLRRIAIRRIADIRRSQSRCPVLFSEESQWTQWPAPTSNRAAEQSSSDHESLQLETPGMLVRMRRVQDSVDPKTWSIFERAVLDGQSTESVAAEFAVSQVNVRQIRSRILRKLKEVG